MSSKRPKPVVLAVLDGWGHAHAGNDNAIALANTPNIDNATANFPNGMINASELHVGLPSGQMGNSEVGHMNIGSGRVLMQDLPRMMPHWKMARLSRKSRCRILLQQLRQKPGSCIYWAFVQTAECILI